MAGTDHRSAASDIEGEEDAEPHYLNKFIWRPAPQRVGVPDERENGCHALWHFYASKALHEGETIKAVRKYLGEGANDDGVRSPRSRPKMTESHASSSPG